VDFQKFLGPTYQARSHNQDAERCVDLFVDVPSNGGGKPVLYGRPGLLPVGRGFAFVAPFTSSFNNAFYGAWRTLFSQDGRLFGILGFDGAGQIGIAVELLAAPPFTIYGDTDPTRRFDLYIASFTNIGGITTANDPAWIASNGSVGHQILFTNRGGVIFDLVTNAYATIADPDFPTNAARCGQFIDGYFVIVNETLNALQSSAFFNGLAWSGLDIARRQLASDQLVSLMVVNRQIWLFGTETTEVWAPAGTGNPPFAPIPGVFVQWGIAAANTAQLFAGTVVWLAQNMQGIRMVMMAQGFDPRRISTAPLELLLQPLDNVDDAFAWTYQEDGHEFYVLSIPSAKLTWVYDGLTQLWHERGWWNQIAGEYESHRGRCHAMLQQQGFTAHLVGDRETSTIYEQSPRFYTDARALAPAPAQFGTVSLTPTYGPIRALRRTPGIDQELTRIPYSSFQLDLEPGVGLDGVGVSISTVSPYESAILSSQPAGFWRLNEATGLVAADSSGHGLAGAIAGGVVLGQPGAIGDGSTAMRFDGTTGVVTVPAAAGLALSAAITVEALVKVPDITGTYGILQKTIGGIDDTSYVLFAGAGFWIWRTFGPTVSALVAQIPADIGRWVYLVGTFDGANLRLYKNGDLVRTTPMVNPIPAGAGILTIGRYDGNFMNGFLDEVAVYPTALSAATIAQHAAVPLGGTDPTLMLRYSDDGGFTYHNEITASAGLIGQYGRRAIWRRLGTGRNRVWEVVMTDPVKRVWTGCFLNGPG
jgi:hypothetical protein